VKWLNSKKGNLKDTLKTNYIKSIDYITLLQYQKQYKHGGQNKELILLTPDTFKILCVRSHTKLADKIRYYYITLEKLVYEFKDEIIENQQKHIKALENNQRKEKFPNGGLIYIIQPPDINDLELHKIGKTNNMNERKPVINNILPDNVKILYTINVNDPTGMETCMKGILHKYRYRSNKKGNINFYRSIIFLCDGYYKLDENTENHLGLRFMKIASRLPLELQMTLIHRLSFSSRIIITGKQFDENITEYTRLFLLKN